MIQHPSNAVLFVFHAVLSPRTHDFHLYIDNLQAVNAVHDPFLHYYQYRDHRSPYSQSTSTC